MNSFESKEKYLKPDSLSDRQPLQLYKERRNMVIFPGAGNQSNEWDIFCIEIATITRREQSWVDVRDPSLMV